MTKKQQKKELERFLVAKRNNDTLHPKDIPHHIIHLEQPDVTYHIGIAQGMPYLAHGPEQDYARALVASHA